MSGYERKYQIGSSGQAIDDMVIGAIAKARSLAIAAISVEVDRLKLSVVRGDVTSSFHGLAAPGCYEQVLIDELDSIIRYLRKGAT